MGRGVAAAPTVMPAAVSGGGLERDDWRRFDNSVNAVSFGFVATAILISMFLIMAIFERFLQQSSASDGDPDEGNLRKPEFPSPKMTVYPKGVSVLMPGETTPTFLAHPVPPPCPPEHVPAAYTSA